MSKETIHTTERGGMDARSLDLFGQIVSANVAATEFTTNALLAAKDDEIARLTKTIVRLGDILDMATVIDRKTEGRLSQMWWEIDWARQCSRDAEGDRND